MDKNKEKSSDLANRYYEPEDYKRKDQLSSGLATTHEQVSDSYTEGEIDGVMEDVNGKNIKIDRKGFTE